MSGKKKVESSKLYDFLVWCLALGNLKRMNRIVLGQIVFNVFPGHVLIQSFHSFSSYQVPWFHLPHHFLYPLLHTHFISALCNALTLLPLSVSSAAWFQMLLLSSLLSNILLPEFSENKPNHAKPNIKFQNNNLLHLYIL